MDWGNLLKGVIDTVVYSLVGMGLMGIGIGLVILISPFSVKKEIEDDQNTSLGIIMGAIIIGIAIIISGVLSSPSSDFVRKKTENKAQSQAEK